MTSEFLAMLDSLKVASYMLDGKGKQGNKIQSFKKLYELSEKRRKMGILPYHYQKPCGCQLELTYQCNQYCLTCYNRSGGERNSWKSLSLDEWKNVARQLAEIGIFQCVISGGEPLLMGESLFEIMDILHDAGVVFLFITNGILLTPEKVDKLSKYRYDHFQISMDGSRPEIHNYIRGADSWDKTVRAASLAHEAGLPLTITHVVVKQNLEMVEEMVDMVYFLGAEQCILGPVEISGRAVENYQNIALTEQEKQILCEKGRKKIQEYGDAMDIQVVMEEIAAFQYRITEGNSVLLIRPNGDVKFDSILPYVIGNVRKQTIQEIWDTLGHNVYEHPMIRNCFENMKSQEDMIQYLLRINSTADDSEFYLIK